MAHFIDRRLNSKGKSTVNRQRFLRRYKQQIKRAVSDAVGQRSVTDLETGEQISIPSRDIKEPVFHTGKGGQRTVVHPGDSLFQLGNVFLQGHYCEAVFMFVRFEHSQLLLFFSQFTFRPALMKMWKWFTFATIRRSRKLTNRSFSIPRKPAVRLYPAPLN